MNSFFITGFPRSRTAWLANWLTGRDSFCFHEALTQCKDLVDLELLLKEQVILHKWRVVGNSDSGLALFGSTLGRMFPHTRLVLIERDQAEAEESYRRYFTENHFPHGGELTAENVRRVFNLFARGLRQLCATWPSEPLVIPYAHLDREETAGAIWDFCCPGQKFNAHRWQMLNQFRVNIIPQKSKPAPGFQEFIERTIAWA